MSIKVTLDHVQEVVKGIKKLASTRVMVGIPSDRAGRKDKKDQRINNAALGYIHENGAPEVGIPARPFLVPGVRKVHIATVDGLAAAGKAALDGKPEAADRQFNRVGLQAQSSVRATINAGVPPPLAPATLARRRSRGRTGTVPLIDTGQLRNAVSYVIRGK